MKTRRRHLRSGASFDGKLATLRWPFPRPKRSWRCRRRGDASQDAANGRRHDGMLTATHMNLTPPPPPPPPIPPPIPPPPPSPPSPLPPRPGFVPDFLELTGRFSRVGQSAADYGRPYANDFSEFLRNHQQLPTPSMSLPSGLLDK